MPARDEGETCIVSRTLLRRVTADLEYLAGFIKGQIQSEAWIGLLPGHPEGTCTIAERCHAAHALAAQVMTAGNIAEDEDLDD